MKRNTGAAQFFTVPHSEDQFHCGLAHLTEGLRNRIWWVSSSNAHSRWAAKLGMHLQSSTLKDEESGEPLHVPVAGESGAFMEEFPQDTFGRAVGFRHEYAVPVAAGAKFAWRRGYSFLPAVSVEARKYYAVAGRLDGLGYMTAANGDKLAAPVIFADHFGGSMRGSRIVALDFDPAPGYWASRSGVELIEAAARYAEAGATNLWIELE